jgi:hypothetical protein
MAEIPRDDRFYWIYKKHMKTITSTDELYEELKDKLEPKKTVTIYKRDGTVLFESTKETVREAVLERLANDADLSGADLSGANLRGANLSGAELHNAKFYGQGGTQKLTKEQVPHFLAALGFIVEE